MITSEQLSIVAGVLVSLAFFYIPGLSPWYDAQAPKVKSQIMGLAIILVGAGAFLLAYFCVGPFCLAHPIDLPNAIWALLLTIFSALVSNQSTYTLVRKFSLGSE